jgi:hypothetical protein
MMPWTFRTSVEIRRVGDAKPQVWCPFQTNLTAAPTIEIWKVDGWRNFRRFGLTPPNPRHRVVRVVDAMAAVVAECEELRLPSRDRIGINVMQLRQLGQRLLQIS